MVEAREDPIVTTARREALVVLAAWIVALIWTIGYCIKFGYGRDPHTLTLVLGVPDWIFWGILTPWGACYLFSAWFCYFFMADADLGADTEEEGGDAL